MSRIIIDVPEASLAALNLSSDSAGEALRLAAAMKLYELNRLSSGAAAELAGVSRADFLSRLAEFGIAAFRQSEDDLAEELRNA